MAGIATLGACSLAAAVERTGSISDPTGDQVAGAETDIVAFEAGYDDSGQLTGRVTLAAPPPAAAGGFLFVFGGELQTDGTCTATNGIGDVLGSTGSHPVWGTPADPAGGGAATRTDPGPATMALTASSARLAHLDFDCAYAATHADGSTSDRTGPVRLLPLTPPSPAAARLSLSIKVPTAITAGRRHPVTVTVSNTGGTVVPQGTVTIAPRTGMRITPSRRTIGPLAGGGRATARFQVRLAPTARRTTSLRATVTAGTLPQVRREVRVTRRIPRARLVLTAPPAPSVFPGTPRMARITVRNAGDTTASGVRLRFTARGLTVTPSSRALGALRPGARRTVAVRVLRRATAKGAATLRVTATAAKTATAVRTVPVSLIAPTATPAGTGLARQAFMHFIPGSPGVSQDTRTGLFFTDGHWVYRGDPDAGFPRCTKRTAPRGSDRDGCLPYTYDSRRNRLMIDDRPVKVSADGHSITSGGDDYIRKTPVPAGSRLAVSLKNIEVYGLWPNQSVFTSWLTLTAAGEFAFSASAIGSAGAGSPSVISTTIAPDRRGTYTVLPGSRIRLAYADGTGSARTILIDAVPNPGGALPNAQTAGLLLDGTSWWS